jgi:hypothetical protein
MRRTSLILRTLTLVALTSFASSAFARETQEDTDCSRSCSDSARAAGTCKDYRRDDGTCYQVIGTSSNSSSSSSSSSNASGVSRVNLTSLSSSTRASFRAIAYRSRSREAGVICQFRNGTSSNKSRYGNSRTTNERGLASIAGPVPSNGNRCFVAVCGGKTSNEVCLN